MAKTLPANIILEKNKRESANVWYFLVEVTYSGGSIYLTTNNTEVNFGGQIYSPMQMNIGTMNNNSEGKVPTLTLSISNVAKAITQYVENESGFINQDVTLMLVNSGNLSENYSDLTLKYTVLDANVDVQWVNFILGAPNPLRQTFPENQYISKHCPWVFKGVECKYSGPDTSCDNTKEDCESKGNLINFGGFPGLSGESIRIVK